MCFITCCCLFDALHLTALWWLTGAVAWQHCDDWQVLLIDNTVMIDRCCWMARRWRLLIGRGMITSSCSTQNPEWTKLTSWWRTVDVSTMRTLTATYWTTSVKVTWATLCSCCNTSESFVINGMNISQNTYIQKCLVQFIHIQNITKDFWSHSVVIVNVWH